MVVRDITASDRLCGKIYTYHGSVQIISRLDSQSKLQTCFTSYFPATKSVEEKAPPTWQLYTGLCKFTENILTNILSLGKPKDQNLDKCTLYLFPVILIFLDFIHWMVMSLCNSVNQLEKKRFIYGGYIETMQSFEL